ncbi:MAG TPA: M20/M25/M40 family metallo-hydrolase [Virgibacillus sp.]|nr:M20/M25/M40 family metallo-hydrolase [Virgibacillus sp.]HLR65751.1 M20/M25/M40 family metallo-hydrolase [Virgibacillus sp.]
MSKIRWEKPSDLRKLLCELVSWKSITLSEGERQFPMKLHAKLQRLAYFQKHPELLRLHPADLRRHFLTALYKHPDAKKTICLISHFDTVSTEEYGDFEPLATLPEELTKVLAERQNELPQDVLHDLKTGNYLFGRGTMDMKMGLALHMRLIEKASIEEWPINLLLLTVPDEEVNSSGMRHAVPTLLELKNEHGLNYQLFLNSEPVFSQDPNAHDHYIYSGTIGKIMPAALFYGKETHAGEPLRGLTSPYIASFLTQEVEWNHHFQETDLNERTPLPVTLQQKDLRLEYSTQTPYRSAALYNVFLMKQTAQDVFHLFEQAAQKAANRCNEAYTKVCLDNKVDPTSKVKVIQYKDLLKHARDKFGASYIESVKADIQFNKTWDEREKSLRITDQLMIQCQELAPAIIILYAPPYYPAVNSSTNQLTETCIEFVKEMAMHRFRLPIERIHYFNGICDLSYVNYSDLNEGWISFEENTPVWGESYTIPFQEMKQLNAPVLNIGPFGKDAHKRTERLHIKNAFEETPEILDELIERLYEMQETN